jgi:hypothetical protein
MPVRKFRRVEDMDQERWRSPGDPELYRAIAGLWEIGVRTSTRRYPPGVHKHRSIADMCRVQEEWSARGEPS